MSLAGTNTSSAGLIMSDSQHQCISKINNTALSIDDLMGTLIYMGTDMMPFINKANPALHLFAAHQRVSRYCPRSATCKMIYDLDITK